MSRPRFSVLYAVFVASLVLPFAACGGGGRSRHVDLSRPVSVDLDAAPPKYLSSYNFFSWDPDAGFAYNDRVVPYDMNTPLFSDYALKQRAVYVPEGAAAAYDPEHEFDFPVGSVIIKSFYFPADFRAPTENLRIIETRLMVRHADGWHPLPYIWDEAQNDAVYSPSGENRVIEFIDAEGQPEVAQYLIPQRVQCTGCHARRETETSDPELVLLGMKARHINRSEDFGGDVGVANQLEHLAALGLLTGVPPIATVPAAYDFRPIEAGGVAAIPPEDVDAAARSYLDINCAHCHNPNGVQGISSQLFLNHDNLDQFRLGVCKRPGSAGSGTGGFTFDIVPGDPATSILHYRVDTEVVGAMMPLLGRSVTHRPGSELLEAWIAAMAPVACE